MDRELTALVALLTQPYASWSEIAFDVAACGSAVEVFSDKLGGAESGLFGDPRAGAAWEEAARVVAGWEGDSFRPVTVLDPDYPTNLLSIHEMPPLLFVKGRLRADETAVSVVGTREPSAGGVRCAREVARGLTERGIAVISGLAKGIDTAAHTEVLRCGGRPIGVIGTGIRRVYPRVNAGLHDEVAAAGALVSQFWPDTPPGKQTFPMRNTVMSGLGGASVIVEAGEKSGTRIQARVAVAHGRPVILSRSVCESTTWARDLRERPGVFAAGSTAEILDIVDRLLADDAGAEDQMVPELLSL